MSCAVRSPRSPSEKVSAGQEQCSSMYSDHSSSRFITARSHMSKSRLLARAYSAMVLWKSRWS